MANILLLDDNPVAQKALAAILGRAEHKFAAAETIEDAMRILLRGGVDLFITEMRLSAPGQPLTLLRAIHANSFLKTLPVLVYTSVTGRENVKEVLSLRVQNYLIKPYSDEKVFTEIRRAHEWDWIRGHFEDPQNFCRRTGLSADAWRMLLENMREDLRTLLPELRKSVEIRSVEGCRERIGRLSASAESCGFWTLYDILTDLVAAVDKDQWIRVNVAIANVAIAENFVRAMLEPDRAPEAFVEADRFGLSEVTLAPDSWLRDEVLARRPFATRAEVLRGLALLKSFPVFEGRAAAFRLAADGRGASVQPLSDLVAADPTLSALVLQMVNRISGDPDSPIEDSRQAVQMLGGNRMREVLDELETIPESTFSLPPLLSGQRFGTYQIGCAKVCAFVCDFMEIPIFMPHAFWAGLLHDLGKKALAALYPESFVAASHLASRRSIRLARAYEELIGVSPQEAGAILAASRGLPRMFVNVMRHYNDPEAATEDRELTAIVGFSSALCIKYGIGASGEPPLPEDLPMEDFPGWSILRERVFPSFELAHFADAMGEWTQTLHLQLTGGDSFVTD
jgi:CheY-like chemotaxis protein